ncbi:MIP18 family protein YitW [Candidatus Zixiibacteriota bacterium]|nr:MIP18 family protein YitW [candidate division Zixibacteria bacterium]
MITSEEVREKIRTVEDPEIGLGVVDLGLIYDIDVTDGRIVTVIMTLTTPACPYGPVLVEQVKEKIKEMPGVEKVDVMVVWDPPWNPEEMASDMAKDALGIW